jgi:hypothetical protein
MSLIDLQHINQKIKQKLFEIAYTIKCFNKSGDTDISRYAELYFKDILNQIFKSKSWIFEKAEKINQDTYDLFDINNRVCIQITSNTRSNKKLDSINKFIKNNHHTNFDKLIILFLSDKKPKAANISQHEFEYIDYNIIEFASLVESNCGHTELLEIRDILYNNIDLPKKTKVENNGKRITRKITEEDFLKYVKLEKELKQELLIPEYWKSISSEESFKNPYLKFKSSRFILRAFDDDTYPSVENNSKWNRTFMYDFYERGILIWIGALQDYKVLINQKDEWIIRRFTDREKPIPKGFEEAHLRILGKLPYSNILHYKDGDEYYNDIHLFCNYRGIDESPFDELVYYYSYNNQYFQTELDPKKELT